MSDWMDDPRLARTINAFALEFAIRYMREAASLFGDDYDCAMIFLAILEVNGRQNVREPYFRQDYADVRQSIPAELAQPISRKAISESLGMSRETVRRKISALIEQGYLVEDDRGGVITARGVIANDDFLAAQGRILGYFRQLRADLRRYVTGKEDP
jgi:biotin operon repressor